MFWPAIDSHCIHSVYFFDLVMPSNKAHVLVTNDDGIDSFFLRVLVDALVNRFRVTVAAPMGEQSWIGRAFSRNRDVHVAERDDLPCRAFALDGTPSDCVNIAMGHLVKDDPVDAVCSGINIGFNACTPLVLSSGTVAGAIEGAGWGLPALAFSHQVPDTEYEYIRTHHGQASGSLETSLRNAADHAGQFTEGFIGQEATRPIVQNYNFPIGTTGETPVERTDLLPITLRPIFAKDTSATYRFQYPEEVKLQTEGPYDMPCLMRGHISHTVLDFNRLGETRDL